GPRRATVGPGFHRAHFTIGISGWVLRGESCCFCCCGDGIPTEEKKLRTESSNGRRRKISLSSRMRVASSVDGPQSSVIPAWDKMTSSAAEDGFGPCATEASEPRQVRKEAAIRRCPRAPQANLNSSSAAETS